MQFSCFFVCNNALVCRQNSNTQSTQNSRNFLASCIYTKTWFRNSLKTCDNFFVLVCTVFQCDMDCFEYSIFYDVIFLDISFI